MLNFLAQADIAQNLTNGDFWSGALDFLKTNGPAYGLKVVMAIVILLVGRVVAGSLRGALGKVMKVRHVDPSLIGFVGSLAYFTIIAFTVVAVIGQFGVQTASFVALLGAAGFAVGMALQGTLGNFASGVMILLFRPFKAGDFIEAAGVMGSVQEIQIFSTTLSTPDNVKIVVPNGSLFGGIIKNYNGYETRRLDMVMGIGYGSDIDRAMAIIKDLLGKDERVLADPAPVVAVAELANSSVNIVIRPWVMSGDYWNLKFDFQKSCKEAFDAAGIEIPFPQSVVHLSKVAE